MAMLWGGLASASGRPIQSTDDPRIQRARAVLAATTALSTEDVNVIREAVRAALADRYVVRKIAGGPTAEADQGREDEFIFDARGRVSFHRFSQTDPVRPGTRLQTILEFTDLPAVRCTDGSPYPNRRLGFTYSEGRNGWGVGRATMVDENGLWADVSTVQTLIHKPNEVFADAGPRTIDRRPARGLTHKAAGGSWAFERTLWIDAQSLLPLVDVTVAALEGKRAEISVIWSYPPLRPITRPLGMVPPKCI